MSGALGASSSQAATAMLRHRSPKSAVSNHSVRMIARVTTNSTDASRRTTNGSYYSALSAIMGSSRDARRAGRYPQTSTRPPSPQPPARSSCIGRRQPEQQRGHEGRPLASAAPTPITTPIATSINDSRITMRMTSLRCAPSAMRMPISVVRRVTLYDISPNRPIDATSSARPPKSAYAFAKTRSCAKRRFDLLGLRRHVHQRHVRIDLTDRFANRADTPSWIAGCADHERHRADRTLHVRHVHRRRRGVAHAVVLHVADDADDFDLSAGFRAVPNRWPDADSRREELPHRRLVDHRHLRARLGCRARSSRVRDQRNLHRLEEIGERR